MRSISGNRSRYTRSITFAVVWLFLVLLVVWMGSGHYTFGDDLRAYWSAWQGGGLYEPGAQVGELTFLYSPAFAQLTWPITLVPFDVVRVIWGMAAFVAFAWLAWPLPLAARLGAIGLGACSAVVGNLDWVIALALALSVRWPAAWALIALTRITACVAMVAELARRRLRAIAVAAAAIVILSAASFAVAPYLWFDWAQVLIRSAAHPSDGHWVAFAMPPLFVRLVAAAAIATLAPRWPAAVVVAAVVGSPDVWPWTLVILLAAVRLQGPADGIAHVALVPSQELVAAPAEPSVATVSA